MRFMMLALISILASGCSMLPTRTIMLGGVEDILNVPAGSKICETPLPTDEKKTYCVVTNKASVLISLDAMNRLEKECD